MRTEKQQQASRENGARSHGPTTTEGKANSARNATTHGLTAKNPILLSVEDREAFDRLRQEHETLFRPANVVERQLVGEMVSVQWRRQRAEALEAATLDFALDRMAPDIAARFNGIDDTTRVALAFNHEATQGVTLPTLQRIALQLSRHYLRLLKAFHNQRENPLPPPPAAEPGIPVCKNEPTLCQGEKPACQDQNNVPQDDTTESPDETRVPQNEPAASNLVEFPHRPATRPIETENEKNEPGHPEETDGLPRS